MPRNERGIALGIGGIAMCLAELALPTSSAATELPPVPGDFTALIMAATDYVSRGVSQTAGSPTLQGALGYSYHEIHVDLAASRVHFANAELELDYSVGRNGQLGAAAWDAKLTYITYPGARSTLDYDYAEGGITLRREIDPVMLLGSVYFSPRYFAGADKEFYVEIGAALLLPAKYTLTGRLGRQWQLRRRATDLPNYTNWSATLSRDVVGFVASVQFTDTDLSSTDCGVCGPRILFSVGHAL